MEEGNARLCFEPARISVRRWSYADVSFEFFVEITQVIEPRFDCCKRDIKVLFDEQALCPLKAEVQDKLPWAHAYILLKSPAEVVFAEMGLPGKNSERQIL